MNIDDIDRKILKLLQENARVSLKTIAEKTFLSSPAVSARIEKLERDGIIAGYHAQVNPVKLGYHILAFIHLDVTPEDKPGLYAWAESSPNVLECSCVTGEFYRTAADVWKDQYPDRVLYPCGAQRGQCRSRIGGLSQSKKANIRSLTGRMRKGNIRPVFTYGIG